MSRRRWYWAGGAVAAALLIAIAGAAWFLQSGWLREIVRARIVSAVESATGGRVEIGQVQFQWKQLRAEVANFTLHGTEPADKPPLFRASRISVGLKVLSALQRDIDIESLEIADPRIYLIVGPGGRTNIPEPKVKRGGANPLEAVVNLAIGRFDIRNGIFEVENRGQTPFDASGRNLNARLSYEAGGPRYRGNLSMQPLELRWPGYAPVPFGVDLAVSIERNRIGVDSAKLATGNSQLTLAGAVENLDAPTGGSATRRAWRCPMRSASCASTAWSAARWRLPAKRSGRAAAASRRPAAFAPGMWTIAIRGCGCGIAAWTERSPRRPAESKSPARGWPAAI